MGDPVYESLRQLVRNSVFVTPDPERCGFCEGYGGGWSPVAETLSGKILRGIAAQSAYRLGPDHDVDPIVQQSVENCPKCFRSRLDIQLNGGGQKMGDQLITEDLVKKWTPYLVEISRYVPRDSILLYGPTGIGKTLLAKFWYNAIMAGRGGSTGMIWFTERELFHVLGQRDASEQIDAILENDAIFVDECYEPVNHKDQGGDRSVTAQIRQSNYREFINRIYESNSHFVCGTSNNVPEKIVNDAYMQRRHKEIFKVVIDLEAKKKPQGEMF